MIATKLDKTRAVFLKIISIFFQFRIFFDSWKELISLPLKKEYLYKSTTKWAKRLPEKSKIWIFDYLQDLLFDDDWIKLPIQFLISDNTSKSNL